MNEREFAQAVEPLVEQIVKVQRLAESIEVKEGPSGKDSDPEEVAAILAEKYADRLAIKGEDGRDGQDGKDAEPLAIDDVVAVLKADEEFAASLKAPVPDVGDIAKSVAGLDEFEETMKSFFTARYEQELEEVTCILEG